MMTEQKSKARSETPDVKREMCEWPGCDNEALCRSGNFGGKLVCENHFTITNGSRPMFIFSRPNISDEKGANIREQLEQMSVGATCIIPDNDTEHQLQIIEPQIKKEQR